MAVFSPECPNCGDVLGQLGVIKKKKQAVSLPDSPGTPAVGFVLVQDHVGIGGKDTVTLLVTRRASTYRAGVLCPSSSSASFLIAR